MYVDFNKIDDVSFPNHISWLYNNSFQFNCLYDFIECRFFILNCIFLDLFLKIYQSMMNVSSTYSSQDYQNTIDDYFSLGFQLGIDLDEIIDHI